MTVFKTFNEFWQDNGALQDCSFSVIAELAWNAATRAAEEKFTSHNKQSTPCQDDDHQYSTYEVTCCVKCGHKLDTY